MRIAIFSGGTGSVALQTGLVKLVQDCEITNILNLYDNGKSTGVVRSVLNCLGPSDLRKNHLVKYLNSTKTPQRGIVEFYEKRFTLPLLNTKDFIISKLITMGVMREEFNNAVDLFVDKLDLTKHALSDFSLSNIIYGSMFVTKGVEKTTEFFENLLGLKNLKTIVNSADNLYIYGVTESGKSLAEEEIVDHNSTDRIVDLYFEHNGKTYTSYSNLNPAVKETLDKADIIIYSSGTQWSSLIPSYMNAEIQELLSKYTNKTIFIMNNTEDGDMLGVNGNDLVKTVEKYVDLSGSTFILNTDGNAMLNAPLDRKCIIRSLGNTNRKHNPELLAKAVIDAYRGF